MQTVENRRKAGRKLEKRRGKAVDKRALFPQPWERGGPEGAEKEAASKENSLSASGFPAGREAAKEKNFPPFYSVSKKWQSHFFEFS